MADSIEHLKSTFFEFSEFFDLGLNQSDFSRFNGPKLSEIIREIHREQSPQLNQEAMQTKYFEILHENYLQAQPMPGARTLLQKVKSLDMTIGIVTSNTRRITSSWLHKNEFNKLVNFVVSGDDVRFGKPNPEAYIRAIEIAGKAPSSILAVEDSILGAESAINAGLTTYLVGSFQPDFTNSKLHPVSDLKMLYEILNLRQSDELEAR